MLEMVKTVEHLDLTKRLQQQAGQEAVQVRLSQGRADAGPTCQRKVALGYKWKGLNLHLLNCTMLCTAMLHNLSSPHCCHASEPPCYICRGL